MFTEQEEMKQNKAEFLVNLIESTVELEHSDVNAS